MGKSACFIGLGLTLVIPIIGCATSPWSAKQSEQTAADARENPPEQPESHPSKGLLSPGNGMNQQVMAELQQIGVRDPAARDKLMADLEQADPSIWPLVMQQFRAGEAYRCRSRAGEIGSAIVSPQMLPSGPYAQRPVFDTQMPVAPGPSAAPNAVPGTYLPAAAPLYHFPQNQRPGELLLRELAPGNSQADEIGLMACVAGSPTASSPTVASEINRHFAASPLDCAGASPSAGKVVLASLTKKAASQPVEKPVEKSVQEPVESAPLKIRNLAFCTEIQSYGCNTPFEKCEFEPGQEVLLYAEIENFTSEQTPQGYHTVLRSSYQIFDGKEQRVADRDCPRTEEYCKNARRDFFIGYHLVLPADIDPGKHKLQLTIEDLKSRKIGQASIELAIKDPAEDSPAKDGKLAKK